MDIDRRSLLAGTACSLRNHAFNFGREVLGRGSPLKELRGIYSDWRGAVLRIGRRLHRMNTAAPGEFNTPVQFGDKTFLTFARAIFPCGNPASIASPPCKAILRFDWPKRPGFGSVRSVPSGAVPYGRPCSAGSWPCNALSQRGLGNPKVGLATYSFAYCFASAKESCGYLPSARRRPGPANTRKVLLPPWEIRTPRPLCQ
jgi:hypothetical protein